VPGKNIFGPGGQRKVRVPKKSGQKETNKRGRLEDGSDSKIKTAEELR